MNDNDRVRDRVRAAEALAEHICTTRLTDGFCVSRLNTRCKCHHEAEGLLRAMAGRGVVPVWERDPS